MQLESNGIQVDCDCWFRQWMLDVSQTQPAAKHKDNDITHGR